MLRTLPAISALLLSLLLISPAAHADSVSGNYRGFTEIAGGVFELGLDNMLLVSFQSTSEEVEGSGEVTTTALDAGWTGGVTPRYFLARNFSLALPIYAFIRQTNTTVEVDGTETGSSEARDVGVLSFLMANYYVRLGNSFFFKPGIGVGGFFGSRSTPVEGMPDQTRSSTLAGFAARIDLGAVFYASENFNLKAGIDIVPRFGSVSTDESDNSQSFLSVDAGFNVGVAYSF